MSTIVALIITIAITVQSYLSYKNWRKELKEEYGHNELGAGDNFLYTKYLTTIISGAIGIIILIVRFILYGNENSR